MRKLKIVLFSEYRFTDDDKSRIMEFIHSHFKEVKNITSYYIEDGNI